MQASTKQRVVSQSDAADAFVRGAGASVRCNSALTTHAETAFSYAEPIAAFDPEKRGTIHLTTEKFSVTTSKHVGMIRRAAARHGVPVIDSPHATLRRIARAGA
jgi:hypothetical protein